MQRLREFERTSTKEAKIRRAKRSIKGYSQAIYNKLRPNSWPAWSFQQGLRGLEDGAFIAIVGPDGAGKSTAAADLGKFLGTTLDTKSVYLGKGNLVSSAWQGLARVKWSILESTTNRKPPTREKIEIDREEIDINSELVQQVGPPSAFDADRTPLRQRAWELSRVAQALRQLRIVYLVRTDRMQGRFVISDRFPHHEERHAGGPGIVYNAGEDPWLTWVMAGAERAILGYIGTHYAPDLIIRLSVNAETAWRRKEDHNFHEIQRKVTAMERVNFPGAGSYLIVDASQPENTVKHEIRTQVWNHICQ